MTTTKTSPAIFITGGAQGIGKGIAARFRSDGWQVAIADLDPVAGRQTAEELDVFFVRMDASRETAIKSAVAQSVRRFGRLDVLVNNAAQADPQIKEFDVKKWNHVIAVNLTAAFVCTKYAVPHLKKNRGNIINIASTRALMSEADTMAYSATKGGLVALTHSLAISLGPEIRVNCISPGWIDTSGWQKKPSRPATLRPIDHSQHPVGRVGKPEDIAAAVRYLVSIEAGFMTGQNIVIDGGMTRKMIYV